MSSLTEGALPITVTYAPSGGTNDEVTDENQKSQSTASICKTASSTSKYH